MKRLLPLIFSLLITWQVFGQVDSVSTDTLTYEPELPTTDYTGADSVAYESLNEVAEMDTDVADSVIEESKRFISPSFTFDYGKAVGTMAGLENKFETTLTFLFLDQYYLIGEYGTATLSPANAFENGHYTSDGSYFRVGGGYLKNLNQKSKLGFGVRYSKSSFSDKGDILVKSASGIQDDYSKSFDRKNLTARWVELVITSESKLRLNKDKPESKLNELFSVGLFIRFKVMSTYDHFSPLDVYSVPGFGRTVSNVVPAANLYIRFHPF